MLCRPVTALRGLFLITLPAEDAEDDDKPKMFDKLARSFPVYIGRTVKPHPKCEVLDQHGHPRHPNFFAVYNLWCFDQKAPLPDQGGVADDHSTSGLTKRRRSINKKGRGLDGHFVCCVSRLKRRLCVLADRDFKYNGEDGIMELVNPAI